MIKISHIENVNTHLLNFPTHSSGECHILPYKFIGDRAYYNSSSFALINVNEDYITVSGQTIYNVSEFNQLKVDNPEYSWETFSGVRVGGIFYP